MIDYTIYFTNLCKIRRNFPLWAAGIQFLVGRSKPLKRGSFGKLAQDRSWAPRTEKAVQWIQDSKTQRSLCAGSSRGRETGKIEKTERGDSEGGQKFQMEDFQVKTTRRTKYRISWKEWKEVGPPEWTGHGKQVGQCSCFLPQACSVWTLKIKFM